VEDAVVQDEDHRDRRNNEEGSNTPAHSPGSHTGGKLPAAAEPIALWQDQERDQDDATKYDANQNDMHKNSLEKIQIYHSRAWPRCDPWNKFLRLVWRVTDLFALLENLKYCYYFGICCVRRFASFPSFRP
jgi:hypothetical protein